MESQCECVIYNSLAHSVDFEGSFIDTVNIVKVDEHPEECQDLSSLYAKP